MYRKFFTTISKPFKSCKSCKHYRIFGPKAKNLHVVNGDYCTKFTKIESIFDARTSNLLCGLDGKFHEYQNHNLNALKKDLKHLALCSSSITGAWCSCATMGIGCSIVCL